MTKSNDISVTMDRLLAERLEQFGVPPEVRNQLKIEILAFLTRPEKKPFGAAVMTPEASMAADQAKKDKETQRGGPTPRIV